MSGISILFPGQGSQFPGMGKPLYDRFSLYRETLDAVSDAVGRDVASLSFDSEEAELNQTKNAQLAIFAQSLGTWALLRERGLSPAAMAGFSLGECTALVAAGALSLPDGARLVGLRASLMQEAAEKNPGAMYAVIGLDGDKIQALCRNAGGFVRPVNFNCPGQTVIAGEAAAAERAAELCKEAGAMKAVRLSVSGAFHTPAMEEAASRLKEGLSALSFTAPLYPVYSNVTGGPLTDFSDLPEYLRLQMVSPVHWHRSVQSQLEAGIDAFVEAGPGKTLIGFVKRISRAARLYSVQEEKDLDAVCSALL